MENNTDLSGGQLRSAWKLLDRAKQQSSPSLMQTVKERGSQQEVSWVRVNSGGQEGGANALSCPHLEPSGHEAPLKALPKLDMDSST